MRLGTPDMLPDHPSGHRDGQSRSRNVDRRRNRNQSQARRYVGAGDSGTQARMPGLERSEAAIEPSRLLSSLVFAPGAARLLTNSRMWGRYAIANSSRR